MERYKFKMLSWINQKCYHEKIGDYRECEKKIIGY